MNKSFFCRVWIRFVQWIINHILKGTHAYSMKRMLLRSAGMKVGNGTQVVGPISFDFAHISIGENCWINQQVTIGYKAEGCPVIGNNVMITCGAKVLGDITVADGAVIGANAVVIRDVDPGAVMGGVPAKRLK